MESVNGEIRVVDFVRDNRVEWFDDYELVGNYHALFHVVVL